MKWTVTRQHQWPDGRFVVEVSSGGLDYANPGALSRKYRGEFEQFTDPREAASTAIEICRAWRKDGQPNAKVGYGSTGGTTMPFDPCTFEELTAWAQEAWEKIPKCAECGDPLDEKWGPVWMHHSERDCCSERCAEKHYQEQEA